MSLIQSGQLFHSGPMSSVACGPSLPRARTLSQNPTRWTSEDITAHALVSLSRLKQTLRQPTTAWLSVPQDHLSSSPKLLLRKSGFLKFDFLLEQDKGRCGCLPSKRVHKCGGDTCTLSGVADLQGTRFPSTPLLAPHTPPTIINSRKRLKGSFAPSAEGKRSRGRL